MEAWLKNPLNFFLLLTLVNILFYLLTLLISFYFGAKSKQKLMKKSKSDVRLSLIILFINIAMALPGYLLFYYDVIYFVYFFSVIDLLVDFVILLLLIDLNMYFAHTLSHKVKLLKKLHERHHTHEEFNELSLYVMHPLETLGLGMLITLIFYFYHFNIYAVICFLIFNWYWGMIGHLVVDDERPPIFITNSQFHAIHHQDGKQNLGFYTTIWDKLFGTFKESIKS
jgi:sterol desaturase/sphingolipid hydroxylase (fatty acid hydroxylase superfamily)